MDDGQILIVEDERLVAEDIKETLKELGYTVMGIVDNGEEAVESVREEEPDLVLMDIVLKGEMDGIEAARIINSEFDVPVIYLTAYADDKRLKRAKVTEPYGYILKPYRERELHSNIEMAFHKNEMEKKLKESERKYRAIFENTGTAMALIEEDRTASLVNQKMEELTGYPKEKLEGDMRWDEVVSDADLEKMRMYHEKRREDPESVPSRYTFTVINRFGDVRKVLAQVGMISGTKKSIISAIDVTEERRRFETMRESQEAFRNLFERCHDAVILIDQEGRCKEVNHNFCHLLGYSEEELSEKECTDILIKKDAEKLHELFHEMFKGEVKEESLVVTGTTKDDEEISLEGRFTSVTDVEGKPLYLIWNIKFD